MEASAGSLPSTLNRTTKKLERPEQGKESLYSYINIYDRWKLNIFEEVTKLMNTEEYKDNMFLARLSLEIGKSNKVKIKFLIPKSALKNAVLRAKYSSEFLALPDELKDMLISYNILEDGAVNRYGAITQVITGDSEAINGNMNSYNEVIREYERLKEEIIETATKNNMPFFHDFFFTVPLAGNFDFKPLSKKFIEASEELTDYVEKLDIPSDYIFLKGVSGNFVIYGANRYYRQATFDKGISAWKKVNVEPYTEIARNEFENLLTQEEYSRMKSGGIVTKEFKNLLRSNLLGENTDYYTRTPRNRKIALVKVKGSNTTFEVIKTTFTKNDGLYLQSTVSYEIYDDSVLEKEKINTTTIC
jgi:hypothetical protein